MDLDEAGIEAAIKLSERDLSALRFAASFVRGYEDSLGGDGVVGRKEGEATSDVLAAIVSRAERHLFRPGPDGMEPTVRSPQDEDHEAAYKQGYRDGVNDSTNAHLSRCQSSERDTEKLSRLRSALERVESHGSGIAVTIAREALAEFTAPKEDER